MRTGRPPINHKLGKPVVLRVPYQAAQIAQLERLRRVYRRSITRQTFPQWCRTMLDQQAAFMEHA